MKLCKWVSSNNNFFSSEDRNILFSCCRRIVQFLIKKITLTIQLQNMFYLTKIGEESAPIFGFLMCNNGIFASCRASPENHAVIRAQIPWCWAPPASRRKWQLRFLFLRGRHGREGLVHPRWLWYGLCYNDMASGCLCRLRSDFCHAAAFQRLLVLCDQRCSL